MRKRMTWGRTGLAGWLFIVVLLGLAVWLFVRGMSGVRDVNAPVNMGKAGVGRRLADVGLTRLDGSPLRLRSFEGHPLWINFFETWCVPCKAEIPEIEQRYAALRPRGLIVVGVDMDESPEVVAAFAKRFRMKYPVAIDDGPAGAAFDIRNIPVSVFVDQAGTVRAMHIGQMPPPVMDADLRQIMPDP
jgi:thiol-disulfide isomerase/thioredoxin